MQNKIPQTLLHNLDEIANCTPEHIEWILRRTILEVLVPVMRVMNKEATAALYNGMLEDTGKFIKRLVEETDEGCNLDLVDCINEVLDTYNKFSNKD